MIYNFPEFYDLQYQNYFDDINFYGNLALDYGGSVLEIGAGTARLSIALAKRGLEVVGIDNSQVMLEHAKQKIAKEDLGNQINLQKANMQDFKFKQKFSVIIAPFNVLAHAYSLQSQDKILSNIKNHLSAGGVFALDMFNPNFSQLDSLKIVPEWQHLSDETSELFVYQSLNKDKQIIISKYYLDSLNKGVLQRKTSILKQRYYHRFELERALKYAGFENLQFFGDFDRSVYSVSKPHLIVLAK